MPLAYDFYQVHTQIIWFSRSVWVCYSELHICVSEKWISDEMCHCSKSIYRFLNSSTAHLAKNEKPHGKFKPSWIRELKIYIIFNNVWHIMPLFGLCYILFAHLKVYDLKGKWQVKPISWWFTNVGGSTSCDKLQHKKKHKWACFTLTLIRQNKINRPWVFTDRMSIPSLSLKATARLLDCYHATFWLQRTVHFSSLW